MGEIDTSIIELDSVHFTSNGSCYDSTGTTPDVHNFEESAKVGFGEGLHFEHGLCKNKTYCHEWNHMKVCSGRAGEAVEEWDGNNTIHANHGKMCIQMVGAVIKDAKVDHLIAKKMATKGMKVEEGHCAKHFSDKIYHKAIHGVHISVWE